MANIKGVLLGTLKDLGEEDFNEFKWFLQDQGVLQNFPTIPKYQLENANRMNTVDQMVQMYSEKTVQVTKMVLRMMNQNDLVKKLSNNIPETTGFPGHMGTLKNISVVVLGNGDSDDSQHRDMSLLVVEERFSIGQVWDQIEQLKKKTGKGTDKFIVVLPLYCKDTDYPFRCCTLEQVFSDLRKLTEGRHLMSTSNRHADPYSARPHPLENKVTLVLLGMSGTGKSASGNTILRKKQFESRASSTLVTREWQEAEIMIGRKRVRVIDTPDIFDDQIELSVKNELERKCKELYTQDSCVFLLVMQVSRYTDGERDILKRLEEAFQNRIREKTVILFTRGEELQRAGMSFEGFLHSCQPDLKKKIIEKCGKRCVLFENRASDSRQVEKLMETVDRMIKKQ